MSAPRPSTSSGSIALGLALVLTAPACARSGLDLERVERQLLDQLQEARRALGAPSLEMHADLSRLAEERAEELARRTDLGSTSAELTALEGRLWRLGYAPHYWRMAIVAGHLSDTTIGRTRFEPDLLRTELEHVAVSCVPWTSAPQRTDEGLRADPLEQTLCLVMVGERQIRYQLRVAEPLRDLEAVRRAVLTEVNRVREARGLPPLERDEVADAVAQRHAEDMLERGFYSHRNPDGDRPRERAVAAGFRARKLGENIAKVVTTPVDAVARWMASSGHRRNILLRGARLHGLGVAVGIEDGEVVALWCQLIAE